MERVGRGERGCERGRGHAVVVLGALVLGALVVSGCDSGSASGSAAPRESRRDPRAARACASVEGRLTDAYDSTVESVLTSTVMRGPGERAPTSGPLVGRAPKEYVALCYVDGDFPIPKGPAERAVYAVTPDGLVHGLAFGPRDRLPPTRP